MAARGSFHFVRHGETDANSQGLLCGAKWDIDLNDAGHSQALQAAQTLKNSDTRIQTLFCSPLSRAKSTARYFSEALQLPLVVIDDLREWELGDWDGKPSSEIAPAFDADLDPPNGESVEAFQCRVVAAIQSITSRNDTPLVVSHGAVWKRLCRHFGRDYRQIGNCQVTRFDMFASRWGNEHPHAT